MDKKLTEIHQTATMPASPQAVYEAWIDGPGHAAMTGAGASSDPKVGGDFTAWDGYIEGTYLELVPNEKIVMRWTSGEWPDGYEPSNLTVSFKAVDGGTEVTLDQTEVPAEQAQDYADGWEDYYWAPMKEYFTK